MKVINKKTPNREYWYVWCPGCNDAHQFDDSWSFNGNMEEPTFEPSLLVNGDQMFPNPSSPRCHSFLREGRWDFLSDCSHKLAGLEVPMVDMPDDFKVE